MQRPPGVAEPAGSASQAHRLLSAASGIAVRTGRAANEAASFARAAVLSARRGSAYRLILRSTLPYCLRSGPMV